RLIGPARQDAGLPRELPGVFDPRPLRGRCCRAAACRRGDSSSQRCRKSGKRSVNVGIKETHSDLGELARLCSSTTLREKPMTRFLQYRCAIVAMIAFNLIFATAALAQMPPSPWKKAAPFPEPDEELYG